MEYPTEIDRIEESSVHLLKTPPRDWAGLLAKLRWLGLEQQAHHLETALQSLPAEQRDGAMFDPLNTD
jgi:hypothetical protein